MQTSSAQVVDTEYLVRQASTAGYQWASLLVPPAYIAYVTVRRGRGALSLNKALRATWVGGFSGIVAWRRAFDLETSLTDRPLQVLLLQGLHPMLDMHTQVRSLCG